MPVTLATAPPVTSALMKVIVKLATSCAFAWAVALSVKLKVATVELVRVNTAVKPAGTLVTRPTIRDPSVPTKVSPVKVMVSVAVIEPSFATASANVVALYAADTAGAALALDNPVIPNASVNTPVITARAILLEPNNGVVVRKGVFMSVSSLL